MIHKRVAKYYRSAATWPFAAPDSSAAKMIHNEQVLRESWYLLNLVLVYRRETIENTNL